MNSKLFLNISLYSFLLLFPNLLIAQDKASEKEKLLLLACITNNSEEVFELLGQGYKLNNSKEASYHLYLLLHNQTVFESGLILENSEVVSDGEYPLRKPEDLDIFTLLLRAGADTSMHKIVGRDIPGSSKLELSPEITFYMGGEDRNNSRIAYMSDSGLNAFEYALVNNLTDFVEAFDVISTPLLKDIKDLDLLKTLIQQGEKVNQKSQINGFSPLYIACQYGNQQIIKFLLASGADPNQQLNNGITPLCAAAYRGDVEAGNALIKAGASVSVYKDGDNIPLKFCLRNNNIAFIKMLIQHNVDINVRFKDSGVSPLYYASQEGFSELVSLLLENGADPNLADEGGQTPLCIAAYFGHADIATTLLKAGAEIDNINFGFNTPLMHAYSRGHYDLTLQLLEAGADYDVADNNGRTILHFAAYSGNEIILRALVQAGADLNKPIKNGSTALFLAAKQNKRSSVKLLLEAGALPDSQTTGKETPLLKATENGNQQIARLLLQAGSDPDLKLNKEKTALWTAIDSNNLELADLLLEFGADINAVNAAGENLLFSTGDPEIIAYLHQKNINMRAKDLSGKDALTAALKSNDQEKAGVLLSNGADMSTANSMLDIYKTDLTFLHLLKENGATFKLRDKRFDLEEPYYMNFDLVFGMGLLAYNKLKTRSWPFSMGIAVGIIPVYRLKLNTNILVNFIGIDGIYFSNAQVNPALRYTYNYKGNYLGAGVNYNYIMGVSAKDIPDIEIPAGMRSSLSPYICFGNEYDEGFVEIGYRVKTAKQFGVLSILFGYDISAF